MLFGVKNKIPCSLCLRSETDEVSIGVRDLRLYFSLTPVATAVAL